MTLPESLEIPDAATGRTGRRGTLAWVGGLGALAVGAAVPAIQRAHHVEAQSVAPPAAEHHLPAAAAVEPPAEAPPLSGAPEAVSGTLRIPPLLSPPLRNGVRTFELSLQRGQMGFEEGQTADTLGINGPYLGPTLRAARGEYTERAIRLVDLGEDPADKALLSRAVALTDEPETVVAVVETSNT